VAFGGKVALQPLANRSFMAAQTVSHSTAAAFQQMGVHASKLSNTGIGPRKFRRA